MEDQDIKKEILVGFDYSYLHSDWVTPLSDALAGVDAKQAVLRRNTDSKSIWEIILHMAVWNENIIERIQSGEPERPVEGAWLSFPSDPNDTAWEASKVRLWKSLGDVRRMIEDVSLATINASPYELGDLLCRFSHNAYHIGQITVLKGITEN